MAFGIPKSYLKVGLFCLFLTLPCFLRADEALFGYVSATDTLPKGKTDLQQWQTLRSGKNQGTYTAVDFRTGLGHGLTNAFQMTYYLNSSYLHTQDVDYYQNPTLSIEDQSRFDVNSISFEMKYRAWSPYKDPLG